MMVWIKFLICAGIIFFAGRRVAKYADIIAEKTGLGGLWIGLILVAVATSLPEIFTGVGSVLFVDAPDLTFGNLFGANTYNLVNLVLLDFLHKNTPLLSGISQGQLLTAGLSLLPLLAAASGVFLAGFFPALSFANISFFSFIILLLYIISARTVFKFEKGQKEILQKIEKEEKILVKYANIPLEKAYLFYGIAACFIVASGIWLAYIGEELAAVLGVGQNFVGSLLIGFTTTLPEITVSAAALALGAKEMAVANMLGSNLFNMLIIFINDALYRKAPIFLAVSKSHVLVAFTVVFMTAVVICAIVLKPKKKLFLNLSGYSWALLAIFILSAYSNFFLAIR